MEIQNKLTRCPNCGGYYDAAVHSVCPNCAGGASSFGATTAPNVVGGGVSATGDPFGPTAPPSGGSGYADNMGGTIPVKPYEEGNRADSMEPTQIGGINGGIRSDDGSSVDPVCGWLVCIDGPKKAPISEFTTDITISGVKLAISTSPTTSRFPVRSTQ